MRARCWLTRNSHCSFIKKGVSVYLQGIVTERPLPQTSKANGQTYHDFVMEGIRVSVPPRFVDYMPRLGREFKVVVVHSSFEGRERFTLNSMPELIPDPEVVAAMAAAAAASVGSGIVPEKVRSDGGKVR
jgi:hypothetical protein